MAPRSASSRRLGLGFALLLLPPFAFVTGSLLAQYIGAGHFPYPDLDYEKAGLGTTATYTEPIDHAMGIWTVLTDVDLTEDTDGSWDVRVYPASFGSTGWAALTYICSSTACNNQTAWDDPTSYCDIYLNHTYTSAQAYDPLRTTILHETGHCLSLANRADSSSVMGGASVPNRTDIDLVDARY